MRIRDRVIFGVKCLVLAVGGLLSGCDTGTESASAPVISSVVPSAGKIGTTVAIQGTSFGTAVGTAVFKDPAGNAFAATIDTWTDSLILTRVPSVSGADVAAVATTVGLTTAGGTVPTSVPAFTVTTQ